MASSMLTSDRRWAPARKGMTILGKVPKPINLPSQRSENHGLDPNVEIVPKGTLTWGSRPSSGSTNAWGTSSVSSPLADGSACSSSFASGRPTSGGSGTRPSTAGSDRSHEPVSNAWSSNSRPSSASGILASNQVSGAATRPQSAETRPGSSQLSRFAESSFDSTVAWGASGTAERLGGGSSKSSGFTLSSGDFPTLGSEKNSDTHSERGHSSQGRPTSSGTASRPKEALDPQLTGNRNIDHPDHGNVNTWRAENYPHVDGSPPYMENWHRDPRHPHSHNNMNMPPRQLDSWHNPPFYPADGSWYRPGAPPGPFRPPGPPGNYFDHPHFSSRPLPGAHTVPRPEAGSVGYRPNIGERYHPHMPPEPYMGPGPHNISLRPGPYPGTMPYEGCYGPPQAGFYNPSEKGPVISMVRPIYNQHPFQNPNIDHERNHASSGGQATGITKEHMESARVNESQGQFRVLLKQHDAWEDIEAQGKENSPHPEGDQQVHNQKPVPAEPMNLPPGEEAPKGSMKTAGDGLIRREEAKNVRVHDRYHDRSMKNNSMLMEKRDGFKAQVTDGQNESHVNSSKARTKSQNITTSKDEHQVIVLDSATSLVAPEDHGMPLAPKSVEGSNPVSSDDIDHQVQRAKMKEIALQRVKQRQKEEEERTREQKAKAQAKLEELNRRTISENSNQKLSNSSPPADDVPNKQQDSGDLIKSSSVVAAEPSNSVIQTSDLLQNQSLSPSQDNISKKVVQEMAPATTDSPSKHPQDKSKGEKQTPFVNTGSSTYAGNVASNTEEDLVRQRKKNNKAARNNRNNVDEIVRNSAVTEGSRKSKPLVAAPEGLSVKFGSLAEVMVPAELSFAKSSKEVLRTPPDQELAVSADESHGKVINHPKPHPRKKMAKNQQTNKPNPRNHGGTEGVVWAPVKVPNKNETSVEIKSSASETTDHSGKNGRDIQSGVKAKRAEMERYVPKPVAKELSQQANLPQNSASVTQPAIASDTRNADNIKHNNHGKISKSWRQRGSDEPSPIEASLSRDPAKSVQKESLADAANKGESKHSNDGWNDATDSLPPGASVPSNAVSKPGGPNRQRRQQHKVHKVATKESTETPEGLTGCDEGKNMKNESQNLIGEHMRPHWQPKPKSRSHHGPQGNETQKVSSVDDIENNYVENEGRRERKVVADPAHAVSSGADQSGRFNSRFQSVQNTGYRGRDSVHDARKENYQRYGDKRNNGANFEYQQVRNYHNDPDESYQQNPVSIRAAHGSRYRERGRHNPRGAAHVYGRGGGE